MEYWCKFFNFYKECSSKNNENSVHTAQRALTNLWINIFILNNKNLNEIVKNRNLHANKHKKISMMKNK